MDGHREPVLCPPPYTYYMGCVCVWVLVAVACVSNNNTSSLNTHAYSLPTLPTLVVVVHSGGGVCCGGGGGGGGACAQVWETAVCVHGSVCSSLRAYFFPPFCCLLRFTVLCVCVCVCFAYYTNAKHTHTHNTHTRDDVVVVGVVYNSRSGLYGLCAHLHLYTHSFHHHHTPHHHYIGGGGCPPTTNVVCVCVCV